MAESTKSKADEQLALNVWHYEKVYMQCLEAARRIAYGPDHKPEEKGPSLPVGVLKDIATALFVEFCRDQREVMVDAMAKRRQDAQMGPLLDALQRRGVFA